MPRMKKVLALVVTLGTAAVFSTAAIAGADCAYHNKTQASTDATDKTVVTAPAPDKTDASQVKTAQAEPAAKPAPEKK